MGLPGYFLWFSVRAARRRWLPVVPGWLLTRSSARFLCFRLCACWLCVGGIAECHRVEPERLWIKSRMVPAYVEMYIYSNAYSGLFCTETTGWYTAGRVEISISYPVQPQLESLCLFLSLSLRAHVATHLFVTPWLTLKTFGRADGNHGGMKCAEEETFYF